MPDPFQNVSAAGPEFIEVFARQLEVRAAEPAMVAIVEAYLDDLPWDADSLAVEVGCGTGPTARRMAARSSHARVLGIEPSPELLTHARRLAEGIDNLTFETGDGAALPLDDGTVDAIVFHTVLCHVVAPAELLTEAMRVLRPGGTLVVCDADFSKARWQASTSIRSGVRGLLRRELRDGPLPRCQATHAGEERQASTSSTSGSPAAL